MLIEFKTAANKQKDQYSAEAQFMAGLTLFEQQKYRDAAVELLKVRDIYPNVEKWVVQAIYQTGLANEKLNRYDEARLLYRSLVEKYNTGEYQQKAQQRLQVIAGK